MQSTGMWSLIEKRLRKSLRSTWLSARVEQSQIYRVVETDKDSQGEQSSWNLEGRVLKKRKLLREKLPEISLKTPQILRLNSRSNTNLHMHQVKLHEAWLRSTIRELDV